MFLADALNSFPAQQQQYLVAQESYRAKVAIFEQKLADHVSNGGSGRRPRQPAKPREPTHPRMRQDELNNFMVLAMALTILLSPVLSEADIDRGESLLKEFVNGYRTVSSGLR